MQCEVPSPGKLRFIETIPVFSPAGIPPNLVLIPPKIPIHTMIHYESRQRAIQNSASSVSDIIRSEPRVPSSRNS
jgi:hypothetical protein